MRPPRDAARSAPDSPALSLATRLLQNVTNRYVCMLQRIYEAGHESVKRKRMTKGLPAGKRQGPKTGQTKLAADRIREAARDLFYRQGIRAVGVDEIVARAGVTKPSLYRSFASKDALAAACLR